MSDKNDRKIESEIRDGTNRWRIARNITKYKVGS